MDAGVLQHLQTHKAQWDSMHLRDLFAADPKRFDKFHVKLEEDGGVLLFDYSKQRITEETVELLAAIARKSGVEELRDKMFSGAPVNTTENRAVMHPALRGSVDKSLEIEGENISAFVNETLERIETAAAAIRDNPDITDVIHIGIGGSDLGPRMVCRALEHLRDGPRIHFLANIDGQELAALLQNLAAENTAVIIASKTFTTQETMVNAQVVCGWLGRKDNIYTVTVNTAAAKEFGIAPERILQLRNWIGGRFSLWSAIGLPIAVSCGLPVFQDLLRGAKAADAHFLQGAPEKNIPVLMGALGVWYRNIWNFPAQAVLPYCQGMEHFPRYLQQLEMESNGKSVGNDGRALSHHTSGIVFGEPGTNAQHAFLQMMHQGTEIVPADFILIGEKAHEYTTHHAKLNANALAQSKALMEGTKNPQHPHRNFEGNRPSSTFVLKRLDGWHLGILTALYEHKVFVQGAIWSINSFDQWGVELGKTLTKDILGNLESGKTGEESDSSTRNLIRFLLTKD